MQSAEPPYPTPDTVDGSWADKENIRDQQNEDDKHHHGTNNGNVTPPPIEKDIVPDTFTPPSSALGSPGIRVSYALDDDGDDFQRYLAESYSNEHTDLHIQQQDSPRPQNRPHRSASVYSLSRTSFAAQLSRLTSLSMPLSTDLKNEIASLPSSKTAFEKLQNARTQMRRWMQTSKTVLQGMDASDDVEWAAQGRNALSEVEIAMSRFEGLVKVYVDCIESIQDRDDIASVDAAELTQIIKQMDHTVTEWKEVQELLGGVRDQVETAMEWTELWMSIMQDIQAELDVCVNCVFECEEKRYQVEKTENVDIERLASIVEGQNTKKPNKVSPEREDMSSALLGLFARMQPLRASLDFLPMRIASFQSRCQEVFPTACEDLEMRRESLERKWKALEKDADALKKELSEDKWVAIFRNAGKQANKMMESVEKTIRKVKAGTEGSSPVTDTALLKLVESYETKRLHYGPAIGRVLTIVGKGMQDRLTVNGEIIRLHADLQAHWKTLEKDMEVLDVQLATIDLSASHESLPTNGSTNGFADDMSSASSVASSMKIGQQSKRESSMATPPSGSRLPRLRSTSAAASLHTQQNSRILSSPVSTTTPKRPTVFSTLSTPKTNASLLSPATSRGSSPSLTSRRMSYQTPPVSGRPSMTRKISPSPDLRPRWNTSTNTSGNGFGHTFAPASTTTTPSPYRQQSTTTPKTTSNIPRSVESSPLAGRNPSSSAAGSPAGATSSSSRKYPPVSMRTRSSLDNFSGVSSGRLSRTDSSQSRSQSAVKTSSNGGGRPVSALAKSHSSVIPHLPASAGRANAETPSAAPENATASTKTFAKRFSMPPISRRPGSFR